jgi:hypothetical protein
MATVTSRDNINVQFSDGTQARAVVLYDANNAQISALQVGAGATQATVTPTLTVHATYVAGDYVGTSGVPMTFAGVARVNGGTFVPSSLIVIDRAAQSVPGELWLFDAAVTPPADSAAWSISDADAAHCIAVIPASNYYASALNSVGFGGSTRLCKAAAGTTSVFGCWVTRGAPAYADQDLTFVLLSQVD